MAKPTLHAIKHFLRRALDAFQSWESGSSSNAVGNFIHFWILCVRGFGTNRCPVRASALAYTTLLALIPCLAVVASISTGLLKSQGDEPIRYLIDKLVSNVAPQLGLDQSNDAGQAAERERVVQAINEFIGRINTGALGVTGMVGLVFVAILLLSTIEATFNDIWGVARGRSWLARIIQYWATVTLGPLIPILALTLNAGAQVKGIEAWLEGMPFVKVFVVTITPFLVLSLAFAFLYQLMPNTRVQWRAALVGGVIGGSLWQLNSLFSVVYMARVETYKSIYGPLSLLPIFLVGLYFSWLILLFGAQVAYTFQNRAAYLQDRQAEKINELGREFLALRLMTMIGHRFFSGDPPLTAIGLSQHLGVPTRLVAEVLEHMIHHRLLVEVEGRETGYTLARPLEQITCHLILRAVRVGSGVVLDTAEGSMRFMVQKEFQRIQNAEQEVSSQLSLATLVQQARDTAQSPRAELPEKALP